MDNFEPIDVDFLINSEEVKRDAKKVKDEIQGIAKEAEDTTTKVNRQVGRVFNSSALEIDKTTASIAKQNRQWNGLNNSLNQITRELPAFTFSAQTGFLAISNNLPILADEIGRLKAQNDALAASGKKGIPIWRQVVGGLFSWNTALTVGVTLLTLYGSKIATFIGGLFNTKKSLDDTKKSQEALNKAFSDSTYLKAIRNITELKASLKLAKKGIIDKEIALKKYNDTLGKAAGEVNSLDDAEQQVIRTAPAYIEAMLFKAAATKASADAAKEIADNFKEQKKIEEEIAGIKSRKPREVQGGYSPLSTGSANVSSLKQQSDLNKQQAALNELMEQRNKLQADGVSITEKLLKKSAEIAKAAGLDINGNNNAPDKTVVNQRKNLIQKLSDLDAEYARKQLNRDDEELQALREKFDKVRKLVAEFNENTKNAKAKIDLQGLDKLQKTSEDNLAFTQQTRSLKEELAAQKKLYTDYENYKKQFGLAKAKEKYAALLKEYDSYAAFLAAKIEANQESFSAVGAGSDTAPQYERVVLLQKAFDDEKRVQAKAYNELLASLQTYEQKRTKMLEDYGSTRKQLIAKGDLEAAEQLKRNLDNELAELDENYVKGTDEYKNLMAGIENLSDTAARTVISNARKMVAALQAAGKLSDDTAREINGKIRSLEDDIGNRAKQNANEIANQIADIANSFLNLGASLEEFDKSLADTFSTFGELGNVAADATISIAKLSSGDIVGGIAAGINAISGLFSIASKARASQREAESELLRIQQRIADGEIALNEIQRERNIAKAEEVELTIKGIEAQRDALALAQAQLKTDEKLLLQQLQKQKYIADSHTEKYGGFLGFGRKTRVVNDYAEMIGLTFGEIEALYEKGKLTERAEELFEQLRRIHDEGEDINGVLGDLERQANEVFTGTTSGAIADSIVEGLKAGYDSFEDFAGDIENLLQQSILNSIKYNVLEEPLQRLYEEFANFAESEGELTSSEADAIRAQYNAQVKKAMEQYEQLSGILDEDLLQGDRSTTGLQGAIRREMTEATASELTGLFRGQYDLGKRHFQLSEKQLEMEERNYKNALDSLGLTAKIEENTRATVDTLAVAVSELKLITKNTKPQQSGRDLGKG